MNSKVSNKISNLSLNSTQVITKDKCGKIKGGAYYYCCTRNKWVQY